MPEHLHVTVNGKVVRDQDVAYALNYYSDKAQRYEDLLVRIWKGFPMANRGLTDEEDAIYHDLCMVMFEVANDPEDA